MMGFTATPEQIEALETIRACSAEYKITASMYDAIDRVVSAKFRSAYESYADLEDAREDASAILPPGMTGYFDDETLTFRADRRDACADGGRPDGW